MPRRISQQDIADRVGVDKSTVSLALRNFPSISEKTRQKILNAAEEMGYRPDPAVATLARQRWAGHNTGGGAAIAYLVDSRMRKLVQHRRFLSSVKKRADARGYAVSEFDLADYPTIGALSRVLVSRGIRGIMVPQFEFTEGPSILELPSESFTVICLDLGWIPMPYHIVMPDTFEAVRLTWRNTIARGYRRIGGAIFRHRPKAVDDDVRYGASAAMRLEADKESGSIPLLTTVPEDGEAFVRWFEEHRPDAVVGFNPIVYDRIRSMGLRVPEDVAFASIMMEPSKAPEVTGVLRNDATIGTLGVDTLIAAMYENEWGVPQIQRKLLVEPAWHEGKTLPALLLAET